MASLKINKNFKIPWFMAAYTSSTPGLKFSYPNISSAIGSFPMILTSRAVPEAVTKNKPINYSEKQIPGGRTSIPQFNNFGSTKVGFTFKYANFNDEFGVAKQQKFFEALTFPESYLDSKFTLSIGTDPAPFTKNPKVLYFYGTGSVPMAYFVTKCDLTLTHPNTLGFPQVIEVQIELILDEDTPLFKLENAYRSAANIIATLTPTSVFGAAHKNPHYASFSSVLKGLVKKVGIK